MKSIGVKRKIDELGRVVIPNDMRKALGISARDVLTVYVDENKIVLEKEESMCALCGNREGLAEFDGKHVCGACIRRIRNTEL